MSTRPRTRPPRDMTLWRGPHKRRAKALTNAAYRNPNARCQICGNILNHPIHRYRNGRQSTWHADHIIAGDTRSPLRLAASLCNERRGGHHGRQQRKLRTQRRELRSPNA